MVNGSVLSSVPPSPVLGNSVCRILRGGAVPRFLPFSLLPGVESRVQADSCHPPSLPADLCLVLEECVGQAGFIALLQWPQDNLPCIDAEIGFPTPFLATAVLTLYSRRVERG